MKDHALREGNTRRRDFLKQAALIVAAGSAPLILPGCTSGAGRKNTEEEESGKKSNEEVSPPEDLMREHGLLNRVLLIYENLIDKLNSQDDFDPALLATSAGIIRNFIESYHEKLEEPPFPKV